VVKRNEFLITPGRKVRLRDYDTSFTGGYASEAEAHAKIEADCLALAELQDKLMAQETYGLLLVFQAMDGSAKDGTIKHILSTADPQGCVAHNFTEPSETENKQDYLRRFHNCVPPRGKIGVFNRSYYEEVLASRIHPERLADQCLPPGTPKGRKLWRQRFSQINDFERYLTENGIVLLKFFLHLSKQKQRERLLERTEKPEKQWKFSPSDIEERGHWKEYMRAYEDLLSETSTRAAPWHIIPADNRWFTSLAVADLIVSKLKELKLRYPQADADEKLEMAKARRVLTAESQS
jgi:PPK2 family polyphosphate:nucleotide phosphotransferase